MVEKKAKPVTKKVATGKSSSAVATKPKTTKATAVATAKKSVSSAAAPKTSKVPAVSTVKKTVAKKTVSAAADPKKTKATAVKKTAMPVAEKKAPAKKAATTKTSLPAAKQGVAKPTPEERYRMVQTAAYFIAERNGFGGCSLGHWADAENEIAAKLGV